MIAWPASVTAALVASLLWAVEVVWVKILVPALREGSCQREVIRYDHSSRIIPGFSQTTQGVKGFSDLVSLTFSGNDKVKTESFQFINKVDLMEYYVNSWNMHHAISLTCHCDQNLFPATSLLKTSITQPLATFW